MEDHNASPEMQLFFKNLLAFKKELYAFTQATDYKAFKYFYDKLDDIIKEKKNDEVN